METCNFKIKITGIVQGVGFRPFVYKLAASLSLHGWVFNEGASVVIEIEGDKEKLKTFVERLESEAPPLSKINGIEIANQPLKGYYGFIIKESAESGRQDIYISPDVSVCEDCIRELFDKADRRYLYPFINCTNCGPRFTIIKDIPYDRINTTMQKFQMCDACNMEYCDPSDRRYHAQPVSCYKCGPVLELLDKYGNTIDTDNIIGYIRKILIKGGIVAIKGLGGYHLACDAENDHAVKSLRKRKARDDKPFALMVKDYEAASEYCRINETEKELLLSRERPIVLMGKRPDNNLPDDIAPGNPSLGIMLPYTPLHMLLFYDQNAPIAPLPYTAENIHTEGGSAGGSAPDRLKALVMTSGNRSSEPIYYKDEEALENLGSIADCFLLYNREIYIRTDDSVTRAFRGRQYIIRRSRGYVPTPVTCKSVNVFASPETGRIPSILACGGELKNTFCINKKDEFYLSHHIGDLENAETLLSYEEGIEHFKRIFNVDFDAAAYDLHPEYLSTKYAIEVPVNNRISVQHHHAHIASCMAENNLSGDVIGVAFDGTGYGEDGNIWGGEFFSGNYSRFKREGSLEYIKMPGGEAAIREPWRMAASYLYKIDGRLEDVFEELKCFNEKGKETFKDVSAEKISLISKVIEKGLNTPFTSSAGRLFDAVSALLGVRSVINYEGQAAIELEHIADKDYNGEYIYSLNNNNGFFSICVDNVFKGIINDMKSKIPAAIISTKFHETVGNIIADGCCRIREKTGIGTVALSGGVFQNMTLLDITLRKLEAKRFNVYTHSKVPTNDAGISLGQSMIAIARLCRN